MARDYAKIKLTISDDPDFRQLTPEAQHLYFVLLMSPTTNNAGVADWRPNRIAALAKGWSVEKVRKAGAELQSGRFVVIDETTEEVGIRSFVRHDGIMAGPKTGQGMANAFYRVVSLAIRSMIVVELVRLKEETPESKAWELGDVLKIVAISPEPGLAQRIPGVSNGVSDGVSPEYAGSIPLHQPSTINHQPVPLTAQKSRGHRLPEDWQPTREQIDKARAEFPGLDLKLHTANFTDHFHGSSGRNAIKLDWHLAWRKWMRTEHEKAGRFGPRKAALSRLDGFID